MPRLSSILCALLAPTLTVACQATVNVTGATETETNTGDGSNSNTNDGSGTAVTTGPCIAGEQGCSCYPNETCNGDLVCDEKVCKLPPGTTTGTTTDTTTDTTTGKTTGTTTDTTSGDTSANTGGNTTSDTTGGITGDTSSTSGDNSGTTGNDTTGNTDSTTGDVDPGCGKVPADMVCVPADTFEMGTSLNTFLGQQVDVVEKPGHMVTISKTFWIDKNEITVEDYATCWALKFCTLPMQGQGYNWGVLDKEKFPINGVDWYQAKKYCEWKGKRLATEAEWELAARGTDGRMFPWGNTKPTCDLVVNDKCGTTGTQKVGSKPKGDSPYGVHDMSGNVAEWVADYFKEDYYYESPAVDPKGPETGTKRVARSFMAPFYDIPLFPQEWRATQRGRWSPLLADVNPVVVGIRCVQTAP